jgi:hypothetical protein
VPCCVNPVYTLSNGQKERAKVALYISFEKDLNVIDEWTSVVDRTVGKIMSHNIQKSIRSSNSKIVLVSCHYDVVDWLNPDWIIDCNTREYIDRRCLWRNFKRNEQIKLEVKECDKKSWRYFSKYHYLSENSSIGLYFTFGLFHEKRQIGFVSFSNLVPIRKNQKKIKLHSTRLVIHPDFCGIGLGIKFVDICSEYLHKKSFIVFAKFSSISMYKSRIKNKKWRLYKINRDLKIHNNLTSSKTNRLKVKTYCFKYISEKEKHQI